MHGFSGAASCALVTTDGREATAAVDAVSVRAEFGSAEAVFNLALRKPVGVFLLGGLEVATLGNGVFLHDAHPIYHVTIFEPLPKVCIIAES